MNSAVISGSRIACVGRGCGFFGAGAGERMGEAPPVDTCRWTSPRRRVGGCSSVRKRYRTNPGDGRWDDRTYYPIYY
jgi:hypothetical protein